MRKTILAAVLRIVFLAAPFAIVLPFVLWPLTPAFPGRLWFSLLFSAMVAEKVVATFVHVPGNSCTKARDDLTTATVGVTYAAVFYTAIITFFLRQGSIPAPWWSAAGAAVYAAAVLLRYWTFKRLGKQWAFHLDQKLEAERALLQDGPYAYARHPLYTSAMLECFGVALIFQSATALAVAFFLYLPAQIHRACYEEKFLRRTFGEAYDEYASRVQAFFPIPFIAKKNHKAAEA